MDIRGQKKCCWILSTGERCDKKTRYNILRDDDGNKYRQYASFCDEHGLTVSKEDEEEFDELSA